MPLILDGTKGETFPSWTTGTRPATPNTGQTGYNTTLNTLEVYDGTNWRQSYLNTASAQASTSGTSIDFTGIPSWVRRITVIFNAVSTNGGSQWLIQIGDGTVNTSGYVSSGSNMDGSGVGITSYTAGFGIRSTTATNSISGGVFISLVGSNVWAAHGSLMSSAPFSMLTAGTKTLTGTLDRVRITTVNGTDAFDAGSINILYE